jgi:hypothetical protein
MPIRFILSTTSIQAYLTCSLTPCPGLLFSLSTLPGMLCPQGLSAVPHKLMEFVFHSGLYVKLTLLPT